MDHVTPDRFVKVFDVLDSGFRDWAFPAFGLIFVVIGAVIALFPTIVRATGISFLQAQSRFQKISRYGMLSFAVLWTVVAFSGTYSQYLRNTSLVRENRCRTVEGPVEGFVPMPYGGHAVESFSVAGISFRYSDFIITGGFNNTSSHGGPITGDSYVRICYNPSNNVILRLEIRDFKGEPKDYGRSIFSFFPKAEDVPAVRTGSPAVHAPWYSNLIVPLYVLDLIGIQTMFLAYLRTFLRIATRSDWDRPVPQRLEARAKTKLRNSMIYWDKDEHAIWLRPRGLVLIQIPSMVAKLIVDASDQSIVGCEIRLSSGVLVVLALFLWTAYQLFAATNGAHELPPAAIAAFGGVFVLVGWINLRMLRSRMERLVEDAVSELDGM